MAEKTMKEATDMEGFNRWDKGFPPVKPKEKTMPQYQPPKVDNLMTLDKIKAEEIIAVPQGRHRGIRNPEGVMFMGFDVIIQVKEKINAKGEKTPGERLSGWMPAKDFHEMRRMLFRGGKVAMNNVEF